MQYTCLPFCRAFTLCDKESCMGQGSRMVMGEDPGHSSLSFNDKPAVGWTCDSGPLLSLLYYGDPNT